MDADEVNSFGMVEIVRKLVFWSSVELCKWPHLLEQTSILYRSFYNFSKIPWFLKIVGTAYYK